MAAGVPPPPLNSPSGSYYWLEWYTSLTNFLNGTNIPWANLNFAGSNITDIITRRHNDLQLIQGGTGNSNANGNAWHACASVYITGGGVATNLPSGWSVSYVGTSCTITHTLNKQAPNIRVIALAMGAAGVVQWADATSLTSVIIHVSANVDISVEISV